MGTPLKLRLIYTPLLIHWRRGLQGGLGWERDLKRKRKERKAARERPNGDQIAQGLAPSRPLPRLAPSRPLPILLKERPRTGCIREQPLSRPGPSLPSSQPELRGWKLKEEEDQVDCFQWEAAGSGERAKVSWSQPPRLWLPQASQSVGQ